MLEVLVDLEDVPLRAVLLVVVVKELRERLCLLFDLPLRGARRACISRRPVRRPHADVKDVAQRLIRDGGVLVPPLHELSLSFTHKWQVLFLFT